MENTSTCYLHRLIAQSFIPNPVNKSFINHKNGEKTDNWYENLEWLPMLKMYNMLMMQD
jgi:hypothetical protein